MFNMYIKLPRFWMH